MTYLCEMPSGDVLADPGKEVPEVPPGYARDAADPHRLHLAVKPAECASREYRTCPQGTSPRWWCIDKGIVNPGVCCRCQKLVEPFAKPTET